MNKRNKRILALGLSALMALSFAGCNQNKKDSNSPKESIEIINEYNDSLQVVVLGDKDGNFLSDELYGYLYKEDGQYLLYDVLNDRIIELYKGEYKNYEVYVMDANELPMVQEKVVDNKIEYKNLVRVSNNHDIKYKSGSFVIYQELNDFYPTKYIKK